MQRRIRGRSVLVTGAAGLGVPLVNALLAAGPATLALYDQHEGSLFRARQALGPASLDVHLQAILGDVRDRRRLQRVMGAVRPDLVFHLAAYKHVPWGEEDPEAFVATNVLGARCVIEAAGEAGVAQIVYPSTDKAIDPPSLYGATKRLVEAMLRVSSAGGGHTASSSVLSTSWGARAPRRRPCPPDPRRTAPVYHRPTHAPVLDHPTARQPPLAPRRLPGRTRGAGVDRGARRRGRDHHHGRRPAPVGARSPQAGEPEITVQGRARESAWPGPSPPPGVPARLPLPGLLAVRGIPLPTAGAVERAVQRVLALLEGDANPQGLREALFRPI